ncbi:helix-turn-helix transcriptional regulator [Streptomyces sp. NPDC047043]|uniref:helix-turn-helix transcriptional regulator n=1 Tax=Streptomyces sp. NPDC047043 TaxID=3154497 RepID=UPI003406A24C
MSHTTAGLPYLRARGRYHLACGQPEPALADFLTVGNQLKEWRLDLPAFLPWRTDAAEALLRLGRVHDAAELAEEQRELSDRRQPYVHALSLRVLAACRPLDRRTELLREALKTLQQVEAPLELAQAKADLAAALHELGRHDEGRLLLYQSRYLAEEAGVQAPGRTVSLEPARASAVPTGPGPGGITAVKELSDAERRVARLAARGLSNRQIAGELFLTVSTVEQHLTRVYRKLKVRGRSELSQAVPADPPRKTAARGQQPSPGRPDSSCAAAGGRRAR